MNNRVVLALVLLVQIVCTGFFVGQMLSSVVGLPFGPINWAFYEVIEIGAAFGLLIGVALGIMALRTARARGREAEKALRQARSAFRDIMEERFSEWALSPAERDVALFALKGFSTQDIAGLRGVSEGTIKAQTNSIYRKAGVTGRPQLLSLFIDELVADDQSSVA